MKTFKKKYSLILYFILIILSLFTGYKLIISSKLLHRKIYCYVINDLNKTFDIDLNIKKIDISLLGNINLYDVIIYDHKKNKLFEIDRLFIKKNIYEFYKSYNNKEININKIKIFNPKIYINIYKNDNLSNFEIFVKKFIKKNKYNNKFSFFFDLECVNGSINYKNCNIKKKLILKNFNFLIKQNKIKNIYTQGYINYMNFDIQINKIIKNIKVSGIFYYKKNKLIIKKNIFNIGKSNLNADIIINNLNNIYNNFNIILKVKKLHFYKNDFLFLNEKFLKYLKLINNSKSKFILYANKKNIYLKNLLLTTNNYTYKSPLICMSNYNQHNLSILSIYNDLKIHNMNILIKEYLRYNNINKYLRIISDINKNINFKGDFFYYNKQLILNSNVYTSLAQFIINLKFNNIYDRIDYKGGIYIKKIYISNKKFNFNNLSNIHMLFNYNDNRDKIFFSFNIGDFLYKGKHIKNIQINGIYNYFKDIIFNIKCKKINLDLSSKIYILKNGIKFISYNFIRNIDLSIIGIDCKATNTNLYSTFNLDNFHIKNIFLLSDKSNIFFKNNIIKSGFIFKFKDFLSKKYLSLLVPKELDLVIQGKYNIRNYNELLNIFLNKIYNREKNISYKGKYDIDFYLYTKNSFLNKINPYINKEGYIKCFGYLSSNPNRMLNLYANSNFFKYRDISIKNLNLILDKSNNFIKLYTEKLFYKSLVIKNINVNTSTKNNYNILNTNFIFNFLNKSDVFLNINLNYNLNNNKFYCKLLDSSLIINNKKWDITNSDDIVLDFENNNFKIYNISFQHLDNIVYFNTNYNNINDFNINIRYNNINISNIVPREGNNEIHGISKGFISIYKKNQIVIPTIICYIKNLKYKKYKLGDFYLDGRYDIEGNIMKVNSHISINGITYLKGIGNISDIYENPKIDMALNVNKLQSKFLNIILNPTFKNISGDIYGSINLKGDLHSPDINSILTIKKLKFKLYFLGEENYTSYDDTVLIINRKGNGQGVISFPNDIHILDNIGSKGLIKGVILFNGINNWALNLDIDLNNILIINKQIKDNDKFYGKVFASGTLSVFGPINALDISGDLGINNSILNISTKNSNIVSNDLVRFINKESLYNKYESSTSNNFFLDLILKFNNSSIINIILDPNSNDKISLIGWANNLRLNMNKDKININGIYSIDNGSYNFRHIPMIHKNFKILKGSYLKFSGDPLNAIINISAQYIKAISNVGQYLGIGYSRTYDAILTINITDKLMLPKINFDITLMNASSEINNQLNSKFRGNLEEQILQFSYILLTGKFGDSYSIESGVTKTALDIGLSTLSNVLSSTLNNFNFNMEYIGGSIESNTNNKIKTSINYKLGPKLTLDGSYGFVVKNNFEELFDGNLYIKYRIHDKRNSSLFFKIFTKPSNIISNTNNMENQSYGIGIEYNKSFDSIFNFKNKLK